MVIPAQSLPPRSRGPESTSHILIIRYGVESQKAVEARHFSWPARVENTPWPSDIAHYIVFVVHWPVYTIRL